MKREWLEELRQQFNDRRFVPPDPLAALYPFSDLRDREIAGLLAAGLAYGNVKSIVSSIDRLMKRLAPSPRQFIEAIAPDDMARMIGPFRHRWTTHDEVANLLSAVKVVVARHGTLGEALREKVDPSDTDIQPALIRWHNELVTAGLERANSLLSDPSKNSASKRTHLYLRWMVRCDAVDPGGWPISPRLLLMPVDVHIHRIARQLRFTRRRTADLRTVREITRAFRKISPDDPLRYDFALLRLPLHTNLRGTALARAIRQGITGK